VISNTKALSKMLTDKDIRPSYQRIGILKYLSSKNSHPTADEVYSALVKKIPTLSKTTVYNSLNLFLKTGLACAVPVGDNNARYTIALHEHGHFKCILCNSIYDFQTDFNRILTDIPKGFKINEKNIYFKGICLECLTDNNKRQGENYEKP
jgi:Fur family peroxide stress response transcriptional regulator